MYTTTIGEICEQIYKADGKTGKLFPNAERVSVAAGIEKRDGPKKTGLVQLTPNQVIGIHVEPVHLNGQVTGYQRNLTVSHARRIARALEAGRDVPEVTLGLDGGRLYATDGQHRLVGAVIARKPIWAVIRPMTTKERAQRFVSQTYQRRVSADTMVFAVDNKIAEYVRDAVSARDTGREHPWALLVGMKTSSQTMSPHSAYTALARYVTGVRSSKALAEISHERIDREFNKRLGEELADVFLTFGTKSTNPLAFRPVSINAITLAAIDIFARRGRKNEDFARWRKHMVTFDWAGWAWLRTHHELAEQLVKHWNKRLSAAKKVQIL